MRFGRVRSGLVESVEDASVIATDGEGNVVLQSGDPDAPLFYRSAVKPFQALAASRAGLSLPDEHLALTCASHGGFPVHLGIVTTILTDHGLTTDDLQCTPGRPLAPGAHDLQLELGNPGMERVFHNCSGKHAGWLAACTVAGWDTAPYLDPAHPLQVSVVRIIHDLTGIDPEPLGVDGCGAPTHRGSLRGLARAFAQLGTDPELAPIARAMTRFGALVADNVRPDGRTGLWWGGPQKVGAEGLFAMTRGGISIAAKSHSGRSEVAVAAALVAAESVDALSRAMRSALTDQIQPPVLGGGRIVGKMELIEA
jgi:L-asparaginase II